MNYNYNKTQSTEYREFFYLLLLLLFGGMGVGVEGLIFFSSICALGQISKCSYSSRACPDLITHVSRVIGGYIVINFKYHNIIITLLYK